MKAIDQATEDAEELIRTGRDNILHLTGNHSRENAEKMKEDNDDWKKGFENYYVIKYIEKTEVNSDKKLTIWFKSGTMAEQQL